MRRGTFLRTSGVVIEGPSRMPWSVVRFSGITQPGHPLLACSWRVTRHDPIDKKLTLSIDIILTGTLEHA